MFRAVDSGESPQLGRILAGSFTSPIVEDPFAKSSPITGVASPLTLIAGILGILMASVTDAGAVSTGAQTFAGLKTFQDGVCIEASAFAAPPAGTIGLSASGGRLVVQDDEGTFTIHGGAPNFSMFAGTDCGVSLLPAAIDNTGMGYQVFNALTLGDHNTGFGSFVFPFLTTGINNTGAGAGAGQNCIIGSNNCFFGVAAGYQYNGDSMLAIGYFAGRNNIGGVSFTGVGTNAGASVTTGSFFTGVGFNAGSSVTIGPHNTAVGNAAFDHADIADRCTAIGSLALSSATSASHVTGVGTVAGFSLTTGTDSTFVGFAADTSLANVANSSVLGANAIVGASNICMLGPVGAGIQTVCIGNDGSSVAAAGMQGGFAITAGTAPVGNPPANTYFFYVDVADNKLKAKASTGTVSDVGIP